MILKSERSHALYDLTERKRSVLRPLVIAVFGVAVFLSLFQNIDNLRGHYFAVQDFVARVSAIPHIASNDLGRFIRGITTHVDELNININQQGMLALAHQRLTALKGGRARNPFEYVPAFILFDGKKIPVSIRLKGDRPIHYQDEKKWSFRIKTKGRSLLFGMKIFSIHKPITKNYIYEWLFHKVLEKEGVLALRYKFIKISLNGEDLGIYAMEEHFGKQLIESQKRENGPILRINEELGDAFIGPIEPYRKTVWYRKENLPLLQQAVTVLESFRADKLKVSEVFDVEKLGRFFAVVDLLGAHHGRLWKSTRYYYNPITTLFEPIGFDGHVGAFTAQSNTRLSAEAGMHAGNVWGRWHRKMFHNRQTFDEKFFRAYMKSIERLSKPEYLDRLLSEIGTELEENIAVTYKELPLRVDPEAKRYSGASSSKAFYFSEESLYERQRHFRAVLEGSKKRLIAYFVAQDSNQLILEVGSLDSMPLQLLYVSSGAQKFRPVHPAILFPKRPHELSINGPNYQRFVFDTQRGSKWDDSMTTSLQLHFQIPGESRVRILSILPFRRFNKDFIQNAIVRRQPNMKDFEFVEVDRLSKRVVIRQGEWVLDKSLVIPPGYTVEALPGTQLDLIERAAILSYSALKFYGSVQEPITIMSSDGSGQGLIVMNAPSVSKLENVAFISLTSPTAELWKLDGSVTFYRSDLECTNCSFTDNMAEDSLNIIYSEFEIRNSKFSNSSGDAFDSDFSNGQLENVSFSSIGNDAIDLSGGNIRLKAVDIVFAGDKGISIGEGSVLHAETVRIREAKVGIAGKDRSVGVIKNLRITNSKVGIAVFKKKEEFGPASIEIYDADLEGVQIPFLREAGSTLVVNSEKLPANGRNLRDFLYGE